MPVTLVFIGQSQYHLQRIAYAKSRSEALLKLEGTFVPREKKQREKRKVDEGSLRFFIIVNAYFFYPILFHFCTSDSAKFVICKKPFIVLHEVSCLC